MRFPFFKTTKDETKETLKTTPPALSNKLAATQRIPLPGLPGSRLGKPLIPVATPAPVAPIAPAAPSNQPTVPVKLASISSQIPTQIFTAQGQTAAATAQANVPLHLVVPQLATGKISIPLSQLLNCFPPGLLRNPLPPYPEQQSILLPLEEIITAIPPNMLSVQHESEISASDPELDKLPTLIDDESIAAHRRTRDNLSLAETQPLRRLPDDIKPAAKLQPKPKPFDPDSIDESYPVIVPPRPRNDLPEYIMVNVATLVASLPDSIFNCPRTELAGKLNNSKPVLLPAEPVIPQLRTGVVRLPLSIVVSLLPHHVLANPMPNLDNQMASLPLAEVIRQLPAHLFTDHLREPSQAPAADDLDIPDPFREKNALTAAPAPEPTPVEPAADGELDEASLEDESFAIFAEKKPFAPEVAIPAPAPVAEVRVPAPEIVPVEPTPVVAIEPVTPVEPAPVVEPIAAVESTPVAEPTPIVEPVAVVEPVAAVESTPVVEPVAAIEPASVVESAPVIEPVTTTPEAAYADGDLADEEPEVAPLAASAEQPVAATQSFDERKFLVDLNRCTVEDLMVIPGVGRSLAQRIIDFRNARGRFASMEELRQVPGIGRKTYRALAGVQPRALNRLLGSAHDGELTLQEIVRLTGKLPGIAGCMLALSDGLFLTGQLPEHLDQNTISVFAPQLFKKVGRYSRELQVGQIRRFTIFTDTQPLSIFKAGDVYLIIVHDAQRYSKALLRRCERISEEIARLSSQRVTI